MNTECTKDQCFSVCHWCSWIVCFIHEANLCTKFEENCYILYILLHCGWFCFLKAFPYLFAWLFRRRRCCPQYCSSSVGVGIDIDIPWSQSLLPLQYIAYDPDTADTASSALGKVLPTGYIVAALLWYKPRVSEQGSWPETWKLKFSICYFAIKIQWDVYNSSVSVPAHAYCNNL